MARKIKSKRSKTRKGEYEVFFGKEKVGDIFKSKNDLGEWAGTTVDRNQSVGGKKWQVLDWFFEIFWGVK